MSGSLDDGGGDLSYSALVDAKGSHPSSTSPRAGTSHTSSRPPGLARPTSLSPSSNERLLHSDHLSVSIPLLLPPSVQARRDSSSTSGRARSDGSVISAAEAEEVQTALVKRLLSVRNDLVSSPPHDVQSDAGGTGHGVEVEGADPAATSPNSIISSPFSFGASSIDAWSKMNVQQAIDRLLKFEDSELEDGYQCDYFERYFRDLRRAITFCLFMWLLFSITDYYKTQRNLRSNPKATYFVRFLAALLTAIALTLSYHPAIIARLNAQALRMIIAGFVLLYGFSQIAFGLIESYSLDPTYSDFLILLASMAAPFLRLPFLLTVLCYGVLCFGFAFLTVLFDAYDGDLSLLLATLLLIILGIALSSYHAYTVELGMRSTYLKASQLKLEEGKLLSMLCRMLPKSAIRKAGDFSQGHNSAAWLTESFQASTILFAKIDDFDSLSSILDAEDVVRLLNELFSEFDKLTVLFGVYKVETISCVYMVSAGVPEPLINHTSVLALLALSMVEAAQRVRIFLQLEHRLDLKIGLHSGPVLAGVVGNKYPRYRLIHDTVNVASRMCTLCETNDIQMSRDAFLLLDSRFVCKYRGYLPVKGKNHLHTYLLRYVLPLQSTSSMAPISLDEALGRRTQNETALLLGYTASIRPRSPTRLYGASLQIHPPMLSHVPSLTDMLHVVSGSFSSRSHSGFGSPAPEHSPLLGDRVFTAPIAVTDSQTIFTPHPGHLYSPMPCKNSNDATHLSRDFHLSFETSNQAHDDFNRKPAGNGRTDTQPSAATTECTSAVSLPSENVAPSAITSNSVAPTAHNHVVICEEVTTSKSSNDSAAMDAVFDKSGWCRLYEPRTVRDWLDLAFRNTQIESMFQSHWRQRYQWQSVRGVAMLSAGLILLGVYDTLDITLSFSNTSSAEGSHAIIFFSQDLAWLWLQRGLALALGVSAIVSSWQYPQWFSLHHQVIIATTWTSMTILQVSVTAGLNATVRNVHGVAAGADTIVVSSLVTVYGVSTTLILIATSSFFVGLQSIYVAITACCILVFYIAIGLFTVTSDQLLVAFFLLASAVLSMFAAHSTEKFERMDFYRNERLLIDRQRTQALYDSMLPAEIMKQVEASLSLQLERGLPPPVAHLRRNASVLYCDIVGFTRVADELKLKPSKVVVMLNVMFGCFDALTTRHRVYKVETIGDAYLACSGVLDENQPNSDLVRCALDFQTAMIWMPKPDDTRPDRLQIRAGIHTGNLVAGVVGRTMYRYHLFGATVTLAEEMEQKADTGKVAITFDTYRQVASEFDCTPLDPISFVQQGGRDKNGHVIEHSSLVQRWQVNAYIGPLLPHLSDEDAKLVVPLSAAEQDSRIILLDFSQTNLDQAVLVILARVRSYNASQRVLRETNASLRTPER